MSYEPYRRRPKRRRTGGWSGPGQDDKRDPQPLGDLLGKLVRDRGWRKPAAHAGLFARWPQLVGQDVAAHCRPVSCVDGELVIEAESSAWATQLRLFRAQLLTQVTAEVGPGVVERIRINGPSQPSYVTGARRVRFGGSRDNYG